MDISNTHSLVTRQSVQVDANGNRIVPASARNYFPYDPNQALAIVATILYGITTVWHILQVVKYKAWFFSVLSVAGLMETVGYVVRLLSIEDPTHLNKYSVQFALIVLAPVLIAAADYLLLGRLLSAPSILPNKERHTLRIKPSLVTAIFLTGDILSFILQGIGAGMMTSVSKETDLKKYLEKSKNGKNVMLVGLGVQMVCFGAFMVGATRFDYKSRKFRRPSASAGASESSLEKERKEREKWRILLWALYGSCALITLRSSFRLAEFSQGWRGYLASHEVYFYTLESLPMLPCFIIFNIFHPAQYLPKEEAAAAADVVEAGPVTSERSSETAVAEKRESV